MAHFSLIIIIIIIQLLSSGIVKIVLYGESEEIKTVYVETSFVCAMFTLNIQFLFIL